MDELLAKANGNRTTDAVLDPSDGPDAAGHRTLTVVAGIGSPHGDDQVGWKVIESLQHFSHPSLILVYLRDGSDLIAHLESCQKLIIVDASQSLGTIGSVTRLRWPDLRILENTHCSLHGVTICEAVRLAHLLGRMPEAIEVFAIEVGECAPGRDLSPAVLRAALEVRDLIVADIDGEADA